MKRPLTTAADTARARARLRARGRTSRRAKWTWTTQRGRAKARKRTCRSRRRLRWCRPWGSSRAGSGTGGAAVHFASRSLPSRWGAIRFRLALRAYTPWGLRRVSLTKSRTIPTHQTVPPFLALRRWEAKLHPLSTGQRVSDHSCFCFGCGSRVAAKLVPEGAGPHLMLSVVTTRTPPRDHRVVVAVAVAVVVVVVVVVVSWSWSRGRGGAAGWDEIASQPSCSPPTHGFVARASG